MSPECVRLDANHHVASPELTTALLLFSSSPDLGEITRNILLHFIDQSILFKGYSTNQLNSHYGLDTAVMSGIEAAADLESSPSTNSAPSPASHAIRKILVKELGVKSELIHEEDVEIVKWAVQAVGTRAAQMSACAIATVVDHTQSGEEAKNATDVIDVGIDGRSVRRRPATGVEQVAVG